MSLANLGLKFATKRLGRSEAHHYIWESNEGACGDTYLQDRRTGARPFSKKIRSILGACALLSRRQRQNPSTMRGCVVVGHLASRHPTTVALRALIFPAGPK